jgi:hypothetical protein
LPSCGSLPPPRLLTLHRSGLWTAFAPSEITQFLHTAPNPGAAITDQSSGRSLTPRPGLFLFSLNILSIVVPRASGFR